MLAAGEVGVGSKNRIYLDLPKGNFEAVDQQGNVIREYHGKEVGRLLMQQGGVPLVNSSDADTLAEERHEINPNGCAVYLTATAQRALITGDRGKKGNRVHQLVKAARFCSEEAGLTDAERVSLQRRLESIETAADRYAQVECAEGKNLGIFGQCDHATEIIGDVFGETRTALTANMAWNMVSPEMTDLYAAELLFLSAAHMAEDFKNPEWTAALEGRHKILRNFLIPNAISIAAVNGEIYVASGEIERAEEESDRIDEILSLVAAKVNGASDFYRQFYNDANLAKGNIALRLADHYFSESLACVDTSLPQGMSVWQKGMEYYRQAGRWIGGDSNFAQDFALTNRKMGQALEKLHQGRVQTLVASLKHYAAATSTGLHIQDTARFDGALHNLSAALRAARADRVAVSLGTAGDLLEASLNHYESGNKVAFQSTFVGYLLAGTDIGNPGSAVASLKN